MKNLPMAHETIEFFQLNEAYEYGEEMAELVRGTIPHGRSLISNHDAGLLVQMVLNARHGDHVEIGSLFGGSAIIVALAKKEFGSRGTITCIDPLDGLMADQGNVVATKETFMANVLRFGVDDMVELVQEESYPWPVGGRMFATGYIDGNHWGETPRNDWLSLANHCSYAVMFDDYCMGKPEVIEAVRMAHNAKSWLNVQISGQSAIFRKRM